MTISKIKDEFLAVRSAIAAIDERAEKEGRDVSEAEAGEVSTLMARATTLKEQLEKAEADQKVLDETSAILTRMGSAAPVVSAHRESAQMTAGEFFSLYARAQKGDRVAELKVRTVAQDLVGDVNDTTQGIVPVSIVGPVINLIDASRPCFSSFTSRPMPAAGATFTRPRITQHVNVGLQATELTEGTSRKMTIGDDLVTKKTWTGVLELSQQSIDWTDPALLDLAIADFAAYYAITTEDAACDYLENLPVSTTAYTSSSAEAIAGSFVNAITTVYTQSKRLADTCWLPLSGNSGVDWADLAGTLGDNSDATAISIVKEAINTVQPNFKFVVAPQLTTAVVGASSLVESYEKVHGLLQAVNVALFGLDIGYAGYTAFFGRNEGFTYLGTAQGS